MSSKEMRAAPSCTSLYLTCGAACSKALLKKKHCSRLSSARRMVEIVFVYGVFEMIVFFLPAYYQACRGEQKRLLINDIFKSSTELCTR